MPDDDVDFDDGGSEDNEKLGTGLDGMAAEAFGVVGLSGSSIVGGWIIGGGGGGGMAAASCFFFDSGKLVGLAVPFAEGEISFAECPFCRILGAVSSCCFSFAGESAIAPPSPRH